MLTACVAVFHPKVWTYTTTPRKTEFSELLGQRDYQSRRHLLRSASGFIAEQDMMAKTGNLDPSGGSGRSNDLKGALMSERGIMTALALKRAMADVFHVVDARHCGSGFGSHRRAVRRK